MQKLRSTKIGFFAILCYHMNSKGPAEAIAGINACRPCRKFQQYKNEESVSYMLTVHQFQFTTEVVTPMELDEHSGAALRGNLFESIWQHKLYAWPRKYIFNKIYIEIYDHYCWQRNLWLEDAWYQELIASQKCIRTIISILSIINIYHFSMIVAILSDSFKSEDNVNCLNDYASSHFEWHNIL